MLLPLCAFAQGGERIYFRAGSPEVDVSFRDNGAALASFVAGVDRAMREQGTVVESVTIETSASPEGDPAANERLAMERARSLHDYLLTVLPLSSSQVKAFSRGVDWEGMVKAVRASDVHWKEQVMDAVLDNGVLSGASYEAQKRCLARLKAIDGGRAWAWLMEEVFTDLRTGAGTLNCVVVRGGSVRDTLVIIHEYEGPDAEWYLNEAARRASEAATAYVLNAIEKRPEKKRNDEFWKEPLFLVRTNLLVPFGNVGVEMPLGNRISIAADYYYPFIWRSWMNALYPAQSTCLQFMLFSLEPRFWFGVSHTAKDEYRKYRLKGHSLGLLLQGGYYDFERDWVGVQGEFGAIGLGYMYALPLGKGGAQIEFEIGGGVAYTGWRGYQVHEEGGRLIGNWDDDKRWMAVPMKAGINIAVPITAKKK